MSRTAAALFLLAVLITFLAIGAVFAITTPPWQAPDEPAHYNYVKFIVEHKALPILEAGDYDQTYNEEFTRTPQNTQTMSIAPLRYENYSPPLYYLLGAPIYALADGWVVGLRMFSVFLGGALVVVAYLVGAELFPDRLQIAIGAAAFVAFVPQHMAMLASVNSDSLAELVIALCVWQSLRLFHSTQPSQRSLLALGATLGLGLLTKASVYYTAGPVVLAALILHARRHTADTGMKALPGQMALVFIPALTLGALWWIRNLSVYGGFDVLGLARHNMVVVGQPTTAEWIAKYGVAGMLGTGLTTTFHSFWGQFGWMAVPMPDSTYLILGLISLVAVASWMGWLVEGWKVKGGRMKEPSPQAIILALLVLLTLGGFIWYNFTFVQYQGRYLFPALIPIGVVFSIGLDQVLSKLKALMAQLTRRSRRNFTPWLDEAQLLVFLSVFAFLARQCLVALQRYIVPSLKP
jgi:4-amino-4-deoxy-L-arabinose transferase-like glycosyltransferase